MPKTRRASRKSRKSGGFFGLFDSLFGEKKNEGNSQVAMPVSEAPSNYGAVAMGGKRKSRKGRKASRKGRKAGRKSRKAGRR